METIDPRSIKAICAACAEDQGAEAVPGHIMSSWMDRCSVCGEEKSVVPPSDFSWPLPSKRRDIAKETE